MGAEGAAGCCGCWGCWYWLYPPADVRTENIWGTWERLTIALLLLLVSLTEASSVLLVLSIVLLASVLWVSITPLLLVVLLLLILRCEVTAVLLSRLERLSAWCERLGAGLETVHAWVEGPLLRLGGVHVELLLGLAREVLILLGGRVVLP